MSFFIRLSVIFVLAIAAYFVFDLKKNHDTESTHAQSSPPPIVVESASENLRALASEQEKLKKSPAAEKNNSTNVKAQALTSSEFSEITRKALGALPRKQDMRNLPLSESHHVPSPILSRIRVLGAIADLVEAQPEFKKDAVSFYEKCAADAQIIATVRARCLANFRRHGEDIGIIIDEDRYPPEIVRLSKYIP